MRIPIETDTNKKSPMIGNKVSVLNHGVQFFTMVFIVEDVVLTDIPYARLSLRGDGVVVHNIPLSDLEKI